jgi:hypothetical protein
VLLTPEVEAAVAAAAALDLDSRAVVEHARTVATYTSVLGRAPLADHRGSLVRMIDTREPFWIEPVVYAYEFTIRPSRIKGWGCTNGRRTGTSSRAAAYASLSTTVGFPART